MKINFSDILGRLLPDPKQPSDYAGAATVAAAWFGLNEGSLSHIEAIIASFVGFGLYMLREHKGDAK